ncbi:MAG: hypothetical protein K8T20_05900 [Planctomycetes bacterium]|nr:hypothetical protein [Planctomycetota bacterium]
MRPTSTLVVALAVMAAMGTLAALVARAGFAHDPADDEMLDIPLDRVENTITLPPDHNARATYGIDPVLHIRRRNEAETRRRLEFYRPAIQDALQAAVARFHYTSLQRSESRGILAGEVRDAVNGILGGPFVEGVTVVRGGAP